MRGSNWLLDDFLIIGFDKESEEEDESEEESEEDEESEEEESEEEDESEEEEDDEKAELEEAKTQLKTALRKERKERRAAQKQMKDLQRQLDELKPTGKGGKGSEGKGGSDDEKSEEDAENKRKLASAEARSERLAERLARSAVDTTIIQVAGEAKMPKFTDIEDVLKLIDRDDIDLEQDEEDPSAVEVDKDTVRDALQTLAKAKKHLLVSGNGQGGDKTGSKFGGGNKKRTTSKDALRKKYPALGGRRGA